MHKLANQILSTLGTGDQSNEEIIDEITAQQNGRYRRSGKVVSLYFLFPNGS